MGFVEQVRSLLYALDGGSKRVVEGELVPEQSDLAGGILDVGV